MTNSSASFPALPLQPTPRVFFAPFSAADLATFATRGVTEAQANEGLAYLQGLTGTVERTGNQRLFLPKVDWKIGNNHTFTATYNSLRWDSPAGVQTAAVVFRGIEAWGNDGVHDDWTTERLTSVFSNGTTNEVKFQWGRDFEFQSSQPPALGQPVSSARILAAGRDQSELHLHVWKA